MFCKKCGSRNPNDAVICLDCGNLLKTETQQREKPEGKKKWILIIAGIVLVALLFVFLEGAKTRPISNYFNGYSKGKASEYLSAFPEDYTDNIRTDSLSNSLKTRKKALKDHFGDNVKVTTRALDKTKLTEDELYEVAKELERYYYLDEDEVTAAYRVITKVTTKGSEEKQVNYVEYMIIKYDGKWYLHPKHY